jgi:hypothetical protein
MILRASKIEYNWYATSESGEDYSTYEAGKHGITKIEIDGYTGGKFAKVYFNKGAIIEVYNLNKIFYLPTGVPK